MEWTFAWWLLVSQSPSVVESSSFSRGSWQLKHRFARSLAVSLVRDRLGLKPNSFHLLSHSELIKLCKYWRSARIKNKNCNCDKRRCHARLPAFPCGSHTPKKKDKTRPKSKPNLKNEFQFPNFHQTALFVFRFAMAKKILMLSLTRCRLGRRRPRLLVIVIHIHIHIVIVTVIAGLPLLLSAASVDFQFLM